MVGACAVPLHVAPVPQGVPAVPFAHWPPEHVPVWPQGGVLPHMFCGSGVPSSTGWQVPLVAPVSRIEHAWHDMLHWVSQQNPLTQKPLSHCSGAVHVIPTPSGGEHAPPAIGQIACVTQSLSPVQVVLHMPVPLLHENDPAHVS
jgi:hypothetical protein